MDPIHEAELDNILDQGISTNAPWELLDGMLRRQMERQRKTDPNRRPLKTEAEGYLERAEARFRASVGSFRTF